MFEETRKETGELGCVHVCTYGVLTTKAAIKCAARGYRSTQYPNGIPLEDAEYMTSLVPSERGFLWPLKDVIEGNKDKDRRPSAQFNSELAKYPGLKDILFQIEGLIVQAGIHASGVIYPPKEDYYRYGPFMRAKNGTVVTQYSLHMAEAAGATKIDWLVTEVQEVITQCIEELQEAGYIEKGLTLREAYDKYVNPDAIDLEDHEVWDTVDKADALKLFQLDSMVGRQGTQLVKPRSIEELTAVNALIRLMADEGEERPMDRYVRHKEHPEQWDNEMDEYGLSKPEKEVLHRHFDKSYGVCYSQEQMMMALMDENICGFDLKGANSARKIVAKKKFDQVESLHEQINENARTEAMAKYTWDIIVKPSLGYSFSQVHGYSYSIVGYQCAWLATKYPEVFWNTACLRVDSGIDDDAQTSYGKISKAVGNMEAKGITVSHVDINRSEYMFMPDEASNSILCGLKALNGVNGQTVEEIVSNRPYTSFDDFYGRVQLDKTSMLSLIKAGAFSCFEPVETTLRKYVRTRCGDKQKLSLSNAPKLVEYQAFPEDLSPQVRTLRFGKSLKSECKIEGGYLSLEKPRYMKFYQQFFDEDDLEMVNGAPCVSEKKWQKMYTAMMRPMKDYIAGHQEELLEIINQEAYQSEWEKCASGNQSTWEMESMGFYTSGHELAGVNQRSIVCVEFSTLPEDPVPTVVKNRYSVYDTCRIMGTVVAKDDTHTTFTLLTVGSGSVDVKLPRELYASYNKRVKVGETVEDGWFSRGTHLVVNGYRQGNIFRAKRYKNTPWSLIYKITSVEGGVPLMVDFRIDE